MTFLPAADLKYLTSKSIIFEEKEDGGVKVVILKGRPLPSGRFDNAAADILIQLPSGYPDVAPDMGVPDSDQTLRMVFAGAFSITKGANAFLPELTSLPTFCMNFLSALI